MSLPKHLHPQTYWEHRCELLEEMVCQLMTRLIPHLPYSARFDLQSLAGEWNGHVGQIKDQFPAPAAQPAGEGET